MALPRTDDPWNHLAGAAVCVRAALCTAPPDRLLPGRAATNPQAELFTVPTDGHNGRRCYIVATGDERAVRSSAGLLASTRLRTPAPCLKTLPRTRESCAESLANAACPSGWCGRPALGHPASGQYLLGRARSSSESVCVWRFAPAAPARPGERVVRRQDRRRTTAPRPARRRGPVAERPHGLRPRDSTAGHHLRPGQRPARSGPHDAIPHTGAPLPDSHTRFGGGPSAIAVSHLADLTTAAVGEPSETRECRLPRHRGCVGAVRRLGWSAERGEERVECLDLGGLVGVRGT